MFDYYCGIDPGVGGALVVINKDGVYQTFSKFPTFQIKKNKKNKNIINEHSLAAYMRYLHETYSNTLFVVEQIGAMPLQGVTSMFTMGEGFGVIKGILAALEYKQHRLLPNDWKKALLRGLDKEKDSSVIVGLRLYPQLRSIMIGPKGGRDHNVADALLIAEYARQYYSKTSPSECSASLPDSESLEPFLKAPSEQELSEVLKKRPDLLQL